MNSFFYKMSDEAYYFKLYENKTASKFIEVNEAAFTRFGYTRKKTSISPKIKVQDLDLWSVIK